MMRIISVACFCLLLPLTACGNNGATADHNSDAAETTTPTAQASTAPAMDDPETSPAAAEPVSTPTTDPEQPVARTQLAAAQETSSRPDTSEPLRQVTAADGTVYRAGQHYDIIEPAQPTSVKGAVELVEVFSYACPHCHTFQAPMESWLEDKPEFITLVRLPAAWNPSFAAMARAYYTAEVLGVLDQVHLPLFEAIHLDRSIRTPEDLGAFFAEHGVPAERYEATANSFAVQSKISRSKQMVPAYGVRATPTLVVGGQYRLTASQTGGVAEAFAVAEALARSRAQQMGLIDTPDTAS